MDDASGLTRALAALRRGDPLGVLAATRSRTEPLALALRGVAFAQLDESRAARDHLTRAEKAFIACGQHVDALRARLAEAEVAARELDLPYARTRLLSIAQSLREHGDDVNATWALVVATRAASLQGDVEGAELLLERCRRDDDRLPAALRAVLALAEMELCARGLRGAAAHAAADRALRLARASRHPALEMEAERALRGLQAPVARSGDRALVLADLEPLFAQTDRVVVDGCRARLLGTDGAVLDLARRPVLFDLLFHVARAAPGAATAAELARVVFGARTPNASHEARIRVEVGRLRKLLPPAMGRLAQARRAVAWDLPSPPVILVPLFPRHEARLRAVLADGRPWPIAALAQATGESERSVQRRIKELVDQGEVTALGRARARRYALEGRAPKIASWLLLAGLTRPAAAPPPPKARRATTGGTSGARPRRTARG